MPIQNKISDNINIKRVMFAMALSGSAALIYEVSVTQSLLYFFNSSTYSVATVLTSFLLGLALGSMLISNFLTKVKSKENLFAILQFFTALYAVAIFTNYNHIPDILAYLFSKTGNNLPLNLLVKFFVGTVFLIIPTVMLGASFPLAASLIIKEVKTAGCNMAKLYSWDLFGAIFGAITAGFILIPVFGLTAAFIFGAFLNIFSGFMIIKKTKLLTYSLSSLLIVVIASIIIISKTTLKELVIIDAGITKKDKKIIDKSALQNVGPLVKNKNILFAKHSPYGEIYVVNEPEYGNMLVMNHRMQCSEHFHNDEMRLAWTSIKYFDKKGLRALNIGLGCGKTLKALIENPKIKSVDIVEINPVVPEVINYFNRYNLLNSPKINLIIEDGFSYLENNKKKYDIIDVDVQNPTLIYSSNIYTKDFFELAAKSLNKNGIFGLWAFYRDIEYSGIIYNTLKSVFPKVDYFYNPRKHAATVFGLMKNTKKLSERNNLTNTTMSDRLKKVLEDSSAPINTIDNNILLKDYMGRF